MNLTVIWDFSAKIMIHHRVILEGADKKKYTKNHDVTKNKVLYPLVNSPNTTRFNEKYKLSTYVNLTVILTKNNDKKRVLSAI